MDLTFLSIASPVLHTRSLCYGGYPPDALVVNLNVAGFPGLSLYGGCPANELSVTGAVLPMHFVILFKLVELGVLVHHLLVLVNLRLSSILRPTVLGPVTG